MKKKKTQKVRNYVAKHCAQVNRPATHIDKKKEAKKTGLFQKK
jgi:hypothetical protein